MLNILKQARERAAKGNFDESNELLKTYNALEREVFGLFMTMPKFNDLRNAINNMTWPLEGSERMIKTVEQVREIGKKDSLRLIAELEEELSD